MLVSPGASWRTTPPGSRRSRRQRSSTSLDLSSPFLRTLAGREPPLDIVCTHDIARRLFPDLPRRSLRALAGYFGRAVGALRRSGDHMEATAFVWRELVRRLEDEGVTTWGALHEWLVTPVESAKRLRRVW